MRLIVQVIDVHREVIKTVVTLLVIRLFMNFLGACPRIGIVVKESWI